MGSRPLTIDAFASVTARLELGNPIELARDVVCEPGTVVAVRALAENPLYPDLETVDGSFVKVTPGMIIAGALGSRQALRGFVGYTPYKLSAGDRLHLLNLGGVIGRCIGGHKDLGDAIPVEVLGCVARGRRILSIKEGALPEAPVLGRIKPIVLVLGSCMNVGKTAATTELVKRFAADGLKVGAAKVSGVAALRDTRKMKLAGATRVYNFVDCGYPSTVDAHDVGEIARRIAARLDADNVDLIIMELGDGILGHYKVDTVLRDPSIMANVAAIVFCAGDLVAAWGGKEILSGLGVSIDVVCGPATDNVAGTSYLENALGLPAANALTETDKLHDLVAAHLPVEARHG
jgi:hypothetical protein